MGIEIRPCRDADEIAEYHAVESYVFANNEGFDAESAPTDPGWTTCAFVDGKLVSTLGAFPFTVRLNGAPVPMGGVTAVGTLPQYRRRGLLRKTMAQAFETMRERGQAYAILWASMGAIYQRFGYGLATTRVSYAFDPRYAGFARPVETPGAIELLSKEDGFPIIKQLYIQAVAPRNLYLHRATVLWQIDVLRPRQKEHKVYVAVYRNADGEARGYSVYTTSEIPGRDEPGPGQLMTVKDFLALDMEAYHALWEFMRGHDLVGRIEMRGVVGEDDPAPDLLLEPRMLNRRTHDGIWMRVVDVEKAIPQRPYGDRGELAIAIEGDDICPWNEGNWLLETDGKTTEIRRMEREPDLRLRPAVLASLLAGHRSATHYAHAGMLTARDEQALHLADRIFRTEWAPHCPNNF